jgi:hypothetical protein
MGEHQSKKREGVHVNEVGRDGAANGAPEFEKSGLWRIDAIAREARERFVPEVMNDFEQWLPFLEEKGKRIGVRNASQARHLFITFLLWDPRRPGNHPDELFASTGHSHESGVWSVEEIRRDLPKLMARLRAAVAARRRRNRPA